jgi:hypothetical protein
MALSTEFRDTVELDRMETCATTSSCCACPTNFSSARYSAGDFYSTAAMSCRRKTLALRCGVLAVPCRRLRGLTALNSFYDRDEGPIGGMWQPPPVPARLWALRLGSSTGRFSVALAFGFALALIYVCILCCRWATRIRERDGKDIRQEPGGCWRGAGSTRFRGGCTHRANAGDARMATILCGAVL